MNIAQAKCIPLERLITALGGTFSHKGTGSELWYFSPFRPDERTASFKLDTKTNNWHDFARTSKQDAHGDIIDLWTDYHNLMRRESNSIKQALKALSQEFGTMRPASFNDYRASAKPSATIAAPPRYRLCKTPGKIWLDSLKAEISRRRLTLALVQPYLQQASIEDTKTNKKYNGFVFLNDKGGYEISIPNPHKQESFKTAIASKALSSFANHTQGDVCVFEGFWDCFTYLAMNKNLKTLPTLYVLNSTTMIGELADRLIATKDSITTVFLFLDNDKAGLKAQTQLLDLLEPHNMKAGTMNHIYKGYKDLNDYWMKDPAAKPILNTTVQKIYTDTAWDHVKSALRPNSL